MRLPILEIKRSAGEAVLSRYKPTRVEAALAEQMEAAAAALPRQAPLEECHRVVAKVGARHGLGSAQSVALWTRTALRIFEAGASERPPVEVGPRLDKLVAFAFGHAAPQIQSSGGVSPFLVTVGNDPPALKQFAQSLPAYVLADARKAIVDKGEGVVAYAVGLIGELNPRSTTRTLYVEAAERGAAVGHLFARDYKPLTPVGPFEFLGPYERAGDAANLTWG